ncbi:hypothetical protein [Sorangium sp. So ce854]
MVEVDVATATHAAIAMDYGDRSTMISTSALAHRRSRRTADPRAGV